MQGLKAHPQWHAIYAFWGSLRMHTFDAPDEQMAKVAAERWGREQTELFHKQPCKLVALGKAVEL